MADTLNGKKLHCWLLRRGRRRSWAKKYNKGLIITYGKQDYYKLKQEKQILTLPFVVEEMVVGNILYRVKILKETKTKVLIKHLDNENPEYWIDKSKFKNNLVRTNKTILNS